MKKTCENCQYWDDDDLYDADWGECRLLRSSNGVPCEDDVVAYAIAWSNDSDAEVDESTGDVWYNGHWATAEELQRFAEWIDRK